MGRIFSPRSIGLLSTVFIISLFFVGNTADAATNYNLISNAVYLNKSSMTRSQIQSLLQSKGSGLATYKDQGPNETKKELASYLIWHAAQIWGINPQVIIATLQKEQSLITDPTPDSIQLRSAMGYGCPDSAACSTSYYGFANQVNMATYQFRYNYEALKGNASFIDSDGDSHGVGQYACNGATGFYSKALKPGNTVTFKRNTAISGTVDKTVTIANEATASLLCYTPHVGPYSQTGYSGSDNFVYWFVQWFGSTEYKLGGAIGTKYNSLDGSDGFLGMPQSNEKPLSDGGVYQQFEHGRIYWKSQKGAWVVAYGTGAKYIEVGANFSGLGYPLGDEKTLATGGVYQQFEHGRIYWKSQKGTWVVAGGIGAKYISLGADGSALGYPLSDEVTSSAGGVYQQYENGRIYWKSGAGGAWTVTGGMLTFYLSNNGDQGSFGYPTSDSKVNSSDVYQNFEHATIYKTSTQTYTVGGAVGGKYIDILGVTGVLGAPQGNEVSLSTGGVYQQFENGRIYWKSQRGAWVVAGDVLSFYVTKSADQGVLGYPTADSKDLNAGNSYQSFERGTIYKISTDLYSTQGAIGNKYGGIGSSTNTLLGLPSSNESVLGTGGAYQQFENGRIYWKSTKGAWQLAGAVGAKYISLGADGSALGYPLSDEKPLSDGGVYQQFEHGRIYWKSQKGAWVVAYGTGAKYIEVGANFSGLGYPLGDEKTLATGGVYQQFEHGRIYWKSQKGTWVVAGGIGAKYISLGADGSALGYPLSDEVTLSNGKTYQTYEHGKIYWTPRIGASVVYG